MEADGAMRAKQPQPTEEQWLQHKPLIQHQFLMCDMSLEGLVDLLSILGLPTTKARLEYKLKKWGILKKLDKKTWQSIDRKITKRKHGGKDSEVIHCGKRLKRSTINKATNRHRETNIFNQIAQRRSPPPSPTNPHIVVCTPQPLQMEFEWPSSLPWLRFRETYQTLARNFQRLGNSRITALAMPLPWTMQMSLLAPDVARKVQGTDELACVSKLAAEIGKTMPEWYLGEHLQTTQAILQGSGNESIPDCLRIIIYQISNGLRTFWHLQEWEEFQDLLLGIGILDLRIDLKRLQGEDTTIRSFMERLFREANGWAWGPKGASVQSLDLIEWLLASGQDPNTGPVIQNLHGKHVTPLEAAVDVGHVDLVELLLKFHADVDRPSSLIQSAMIAEYPDVIKLRIIRLLFQRGSSINLEEILHAAIHLRDLDFVIEMLKLDIDLTKAKEISAGYYFYKIFQETALSAAIVAGNDFTNLILHHLSVQDPSKLSAPFVTPDVFIAAATVGSKDTILRLHDIFPIGFLRNRLGITPLQVAVADGHLSTCELLLCLYNGLITPSLLFLAAFHGHEHILRFLIQQGADVNATVDLDDRKGCEKICFCNSSTFEILPSPTALKMLLHVMDGGPSREMASRSNCCAILIEEGARLVGSAVAFFARKWLVKPLLAALAAGGNPDERNRQGQSALQEAMPKVYASRDSEHDSDLAQQRFQTVEALLEHGAKLLGGEVVTAIRLRDQNLLALLLRYHASLKDIDDNGMSALEAAIACGNQDVLQQVLKAYDGHYDPGSLCGAIQAGNLPLVDLLLSNRPSQADCHLLEGTAVGLAAKSGDLDLMRKLFHHLPNVCGLDSAILPISRGVMDYMYTYGLKGANEPFFWRPPVYNPSWKCVADSPLAIATFGTDTTGFRELLSQGHRADIRIWAAIASTQNLPCLEALLEHQQRLDDLPPSALSMETPLQIAVKKQNKKLVQSLLNAGADVNEHDRALLASRSPLQLSVELGNLEILSCLLEKGADINAPPAFCQGATALQLAAIKGHLGLAHQLLDDGARVNARGARKGGRTALEGAAEYGRVDMLALLIHHKALTTGNGHRQFIRAVKLATNNGYHTAAELLRRSRDWTEEDEELFISGDLLDTFGNYEDFSCCDEIHGSEDECIHYCSESEEMAFRSEAESIA